MYVMTNSVDPNQTKYYDCQPFFEYYKTSFYIISIFLFINDLIQTGYHVCNDKQCRSKSN